MAEITSTVPTSLDQWTGILRTVAPELEDDPRERLARALARAVMQWKICEVAYTSHYQSGGVA